MARCTVPGNYPERMVVDADAVVGAPNAASDEQAVSALLQETDAHHPPLARVARVWRYVNELV